MDTLDAEDLESLLHTDRSIQLVDVLHHEHFEKVHLPGAQNLPFTDLEEQAPKELDPRLPVVVYCSGPDCKMSLKAARLLEDLRFKEVYDFEGGIAKWRRSGREIVRSATAPESDS